MPYAALAPGGELAEAGAMEAQVLPGDLDGKLALLAHYATQIVPQMLAAVSQQHRLFGGERVFWRA